MAFVELHEHAVVERRPSQGQAILLQVSAIESVRPGAMSGAIIRFAGGTDLKTFESYAEVREALESPARNK